jgi:DNA invertase Pin-like site-specific DNA recombinase
MTKHHAIYMRVSTKRQDTASQEPELKRWAESHEGDCCWYQDTFTGTSMDRPGFRQLIRDMEMGLVDTLVVWRLDRLGRTAKGLTSLFEDLVRWKVNLISLKDGLDLITPSGRLMANILAGVAEYETEVRAERILAGQAAARIRGIRWGGSAVGDGSKSLLSRSPLRCACDRRVGKSPRLRGAPGYPAQPSIESSANCVTPQLARSTQNGLVE